MRVLGRRRRRSRVLRHGGKIEQLSAARRPSPDTGPHDSPEPAEQTAGLHREARLRKVALQPAQRFIHGKTAKKPGKLPQ